MIVSNLVVPAKASVAPKVRLWEVRKGFRRPDGAEHPVLANITLTVPTGSFTAIVGPSGCGKSTLLAMIAGLERPDGGEIVIDERRVAGVRTGIGFLFQHDALLPWRTVWENIALGLTLRRYPREEIRERVADWIARVGLRGFERHYPAQLSGGMRKRVALAQTLVHDPDLILMDEPYASLDVQTRNLMENDLLRIFDQSGAKTVLFITHDLEEAIALSDRVVLLTSGPAATVKAVHEVALPRPRDVSGVRSERRFADLYATLWHGLREEVAASFARAGEYAR